MPTVTVIGGITIAIYFYDHNPPHFHAIQAENEILVEIRPAGDLCWQRSRGYGAHRSRLGGKPSG